MFSFQTLLKGTFSLLTCHLQFSITARVSMTLKRQSVQSLSDHKTARTLCVSQERANSQTNGLEQIKWSFPLVWSRGRGRGEEWVRLGREAKNTSKKWQFRSLKAVEKLVLPNPFLLITNKARKCSMFKLNIYHKKLEMKECMQFTCNRPSDSWENEKKSELKKWLRGGVRERGRKNPFSSSYSLPLTLFCVCFPQFSI